MTRTPTERLLQQQGLGSLWRWHAIRFPQVRPFMGVRTTSPCAPTGWMRRSVLHLASRAGHGWVSMGGACTHAPMRMAGTLAVAWGHAMLKHGGC